MNELMNERMKDMKKFMMIIMAVALIALPTMAQQELWQSTSTMQSSGSAYSSQVMAVGATSAADMGTTTTSSYAPGRPGQVRKGFDTGGETGRSDEFPMGDAVLPLLLCAAVFCGVIALRRRRSALNDTTV